MKYFFLFCPKEMMKPVSRNFVRYIQQQGHKLQNKETLCVCVRALRMPRFSPQLNDLSPINIVHILIQATVVIARCKDYHYVLKQIIWAFASYHSTTKRFEYFFFIQTLNITYFQNPKIIIRYVAKPATGKKQLNTYVYKINVLEKNDV